MKRLSLRFNSDTISSSEVRRILELEPRHEGKKGAHESGINIAGENHTEKSDLSAHVGRLEISLIEKTLQETGGNKAEAARRLKVSRTTLWRKLKQRLTDKHIDVS
jgi:DNA-binding NtrC family response regulator